MVIATMSSGVSHPPRRRSLLLLLAIIASSALPWTPLELQQRINASIAAGAAALHLPSGDYIFQNASLVVAGASDFALLADPRGAARLWFEIGHGVLIESCRNVTVAGPIEIDYTSGAHYQGTVVDVRTPNPGRGATQAAVTFTVQTDPGWLDWDAFQSRYANATWCENRPVTGLWRRDGG